MKRIVTYRMFKSAGHAGLTEDQKDFLNQYTDGTWTFNPKTGLVNIDGSFDCQDNQLESLSDIKFGKVSGIFLCDYNNLTSLEGAPQVCGRFNCSHNNLSSLEGAPREVGGDFDCSDNDLETLEGAPQKVGGDFYCSNNVLKSLQGTSREVGGDFDCSDNDLETLEGAPQVIGGGFSCRNNNLRSLKGAPQKITGHFDCSYNKLTSLEGAPQEVGGYFDCYINDLTSLEGAPLEVGGDFYCDAFRLFHGEWNPEGWIKALKKGKTKYQSLILTLLTPKVLNQEIEKDAGGMLMNLKPVWNEPTFQNIKSQLKFPTALGDVDKTIKSLNKLDDIKDLI